MQEPFAGTVSSFAAMTANQGALQDRINGYTDRLLRPDFAMAKASGRPASGQVAKNLPSPVGQTRHGS